MSVARGAYWAARAADELGYRQLAAAWYATAAMQMTTYYGQLAASFIASDPRRAPSFAMYGQRSGERTPVRL